MHNEPMNGFFIRWASIPHTIIVIDRHTQKANFCHGTQHLRKLENVCPSIFVLHSSDRYSLNGALQSTIMLNYSAFINWYDGRFLSSSHECTRSTLSHSFIFYMLESTYTILHCTTMPIRKWYCFTWIYLDRNYKKKKKIASEMWRGKNERKTVVTKNGRKIYHA